MSHLLLLHCNNRCKIAPTCAFRRTLPVLLHAACRRLDESAWGLLFNHRLCSCYQCLTDGINKHPRCVAYILLFVLKLKLKTIKVYRTVSKTILSQRNGLTVILNWMDGRRSLWNLHLNQDRNPYSCLYRTIRSLRNVCLLDLCLTVHHQCR